MIGKPKYFSIQAYLVAVSMMINADEVERALWMLDNVPAYYRDKPTLEMLRLKERLHLRLCTPIQYRGIYDGMKEHAYTLNHVWPLRAQVLDQYVSYLKSSSILELAPGSSWLLEGLKLRGYQFKYQSISLDGPIAYCSPDVDKLGPTIFCAFELIEHLANEWEIYQNYLKFQVEADVIMLSTPLYTWNGGMDQWEDRDLGHLRTYTPSEFHRIASQMFTGYKWEMFTDDTMVLVGSRLDFNVPINLEHLPKL